MYEYDNQGRLMYDPEIHFSQGKRWSLSEQQYLIDWYDIIGPEEMSYALGRTEYSIVAYAAKLKREGLLKSKYRPGQNKHFGHKKSDL